MRISELLADLPEARLIQGAGDVYVGAVAYDSRRVAPGDVYVAIPGLRTDGAQFAVDAVERGASVVVSERADLALPKRVPLVVVPDARRALGALASTRAGQPSRRLGLVGVTGTDGKTTTATLIAEIFEAAGLTIGLMSTVELRVGDRRVPNDTGRTTPESPVIQAWLAETADVGGDWGVLEVSSHGLALQRVSGCLFDVGVVTNLSPEHLDFHGTLAQYRETKARLLQHLAQPSPKTLPRFGVVNADDPQAGYFTEACPVQVLTFGVRHGADVRASDIMLELERTSFIVDTPIGSRRLETRLVGHFNVYNWLAAIAVAVGQGLGWEAIERAAAAAQPVPGRAQQINVGQPFTVLVDFAHTPQALAMAIQSCRALARGGRLIVVFGHPGERDAHNRPRLGEVAVSQADLAVVTADDGYGEDPAQIISQIVRGAAAQGREHQDFVVIPDRGEAIRAAIERAQRGDVVLIAGRGPLRYLENRTRRVPFEDAQVAREALEKLYAQTA